MKVFVFCFLIISFKISYSVPVKEYMVSGTVYFDKNNNQVYDKDDIVLGGIKINLSDQETYSDKNGYYEIKIFEISDNFFSYQLSVDTKDLFVKASVVNILPSINSHSNMFTRHDIGISYPYKIEVLNLPNEMVFTLSSDISYPNTTIEGDLQNNIIKINESQESINKIKISLKNNTYDFSYKQSFVDYVDIDKSDFKFDFEIAIEKMENVKRWKFIFYDEDGSEIYKRKGYGTIPSVLSWDGKTNVGKYILKNQIYRYQLAVKYLNGEENWSKLHYILTGDDYYKVYKISTIPKSRNQLDNELGLINILNYLKLNNNAKIILEAPINQKTQKFLFSFANYLNNASKKDDKVRVLRCNECNNIYIKILDFPVLNIPKKNQKIFIDGNEISPHRNNTFTYMTNSEKFWIQIFNTDGSRFLSLIKNKKVAMDGDLSEVILDHIDPYVKSPVLFEGEKIFIKYMLTGTAPVGANLFFNDKRIRLNNKGMFKIPVNLFLNDNYFNIVAFEKNNAIFRGILSVNCKPLYQKQGDNKETLYVLFLPEERSYDGFKNNIFIWGYTLPNSFLQIENLFVSSDEFGRFWGSMIRKKEFFPELKILNKGKKYNYKFKY